MYAVVGYPLLKNSVPKSRNLKNIHFLTEFQKISDLGAGLLTSFGSGPSQGCRGYSHLKAQVSAIYMVDGGFQFVMYLGF